MCVLTFSSVSPELACVKARHVLLRKPPYGKRSLFSVTTNANSTKMYCKTSPHVGRRHFSLRISVTITTNVNNTKYAGLSICDLLMWSTVNLHSTNPKGRLQNKKRYYVGIIPTWEDPPPLPQYGNFFDEIPFFF